MPAKAELGTRIIQDRSGDEAGKQSRQGVTQGLVGEQTSFERDIFRDWKPVKLV